MFHVKHPLSPPHTPSAKKPKISPVLIAHHLRLHPAGKLVLPPPHRQKSIDESCYIPLGGQEQFIRIRGSDTSNPVIIWLQGGQAQPDAYTLPRIVKCKVAFITGKDDRATPSLAIDRFSAERWKQYIMEPSTPEERIGHYPRPTHPEFFAETLREVLP